MKAFTPFYIFKICSLQLSFIVNGGWLVPILATAAANAVYSHHESCHVNNGYIHLSGNYNTHKLKTCVFLCPLNIPVSQILCLGKITKLNGHAFCVEQTIQSPILTSNDPKAKHNAISLLDITCSVILLNGR